MKSAVQSPKKFSPRKFRWRVAVKPKRTTASPVAGKCTHTCKSL